VKKSVKTKEEEILNLNKISRISLKIKNENENIIKIL